ncbi:MAG TPA: SDR family oxidoreductase [Clostridia bacterium]|nr:SDR family oxidoreductase [Clostridia bacterium]
MPANRPSAIITGASRGIGLAVARALSREGFELGFLCRTKPEVAGEFIACDFADSERVATAADELVKRLGTVDVLVNNAGVFLEATVSDMALGDWDKILRVNATGTFLVTRQVLPQMIQRRQGRIINIASTASTQGYLQQSAYCASKHAMLGFGRSLAMEVKPHNVHVHSLCPGGVETGLIQGTLLGERLKGQAKIQPEDIAEMVVFLIRQPSNIDVAEVVIRRFDAQPK